MSNVVSANALSQRSASLARDDYSAEKTFTGKLRLASLPKCDADLAEGSCIFEFDISFRLYTNLF